MKYGIIVCSNCKKVKIVQLSSKTTKCFGCNKVMTLDKIKIFKKSNSEIELRTEVGKLNSKLFEKK